MRKVIGSKTLSITTEEMQEIIPTAPEGWTVPVVFNKFSFLNSEECHVILNGDSGLYGEENKIFLRKNQGLNLKDMRIESFVIVEKGLEYNWVGEY